MSFSGQVTDSGQGISLTSEHKRDHQLQRRSDTVSTSGNTAFNATGGGTVTVRPIPWVGRGSDKTTVTTTTGTALNVAGTKIGAGPDVPEHLCNGATNGIVLNNTGSTRRPHRDGQRRHCSSAGCTGGTIQNTTSDGVVLNQTTNPSLTRMNINDSADSGIFVDAVSGLSLSNLSVNSNGAQSEGGVIQDSGIHIEDLIGTGNTITNSTIQDSRNTNLDWNPNRARA